MMTFMRLLALAVALAALAAPAVAAQGAARREVWEVQFDNGGIVDLHRQGST